MQRAIVAGFTFFLFIAGLGCGGRQAQTPTEPEQLGGAGSVAPEARPDAANFVAPLRGAEEVPPVDTKGTGVAEFQLSANGTALDYKLIVANIDGVTQSHIHIGDAGVNGPVVVFLFGFEPDGVAVNGILAQGTITEANLIPRPAIGFGGTMAELLESMRSGGAYVNVHTLEHPGGEIRGQIRPAGSS